MLRTKLWSVTGLAALMLCSCEPTPSPSGFDAQTFDIATTDGVSLGSDATATTDLSGVWVLVTDWSTCVLVGDGIEVRNYSLSRVEIVQDGMQLREFRQDCSIANTPILGMTTVIPPSTVHAGGVIRSNAFFPGHGPGAPYTGGVELQIWGMNLNPATAQTEAMPNDAEDPRIVDGDGDGRPGVTLKVGGVCDLYVVQRAVMVRTGKLNTDGSLSGDATRSFMQVALGATQGFCAQPFTTFGNQTGNPWKLLRVDQKGMNLDQDGDGDVSCAEIMQNQAIFSSWTEPDDARCAELKP